MDEPQEPASATGTGTVEEGGRDASAQGQDAGAGASESSGGGRTTTPAPQFVAPSSYLRPLQVRPGSSGGVGVDRRQSRTGSAPLDKEQMDGLVSLIDEGGLFWFYGYG